MNSALSIPDYFKLAADKTGFVREHYVEADMPTTLSNVTVMPFFGDERSQFVLSSLLLHRYLGLEKPNNYFVLCSYPGLAGLFPYVDEYWSIADSVAANDVFDKVAGPTSLSDKAITFRRSLREYFRDVVTWEDDLSAYYDQGLTAKFFQSFGKVSVYLPPLRSLRMDMSRQINSLSGYKVFVHPTKVARSWQNGFKNTKIDRLFWKDVYTRLLDAGITPVVWQTADCYDLSPEFSGRCVFISDVNVLDVLAVMRACHCVLDVHSGISRYAAIARCPYLCIEERHKYSGL